MPYSSPFPTRTTWTCTGLLVSYETPPRSKYKRTNRPEHRWFNSFTLKKALWKLNLCFVWWSNRFWKCQKIAQWTPPRSKYKLILALKDLANNLGRGTGKIVCVLNSLVPNILGPYHFTPWFLSEKDTSVPPQDISVPLEKLLLKVSYIESLVGFVA